MSFSTAVATIALIAALFSILALAGVRREFKVLESMVRGGVGRVVVSGSLEPCPIAFDGDVLMLKVDSRCVTCLDAIQEFVAQSSSSLHRFVLLTPTTEKAVSAPQKADFQHVADDEVFRSVTTPWVPALLWVQSRVITDSAPAVSAEAVRSFIRAISKADHANLSRQP